jgi:ABC-2 type transport system permease protein
VHSDGLLHNLCDHLAIQAQLKEMSQGNISLRRLVYDVTLIVLPLFVTTRIVSSWRWS